MKQKIMNGAYTVTDVMLRAQNARLGTKVFNINLRGVKAKARICYHRDFEGEGNHAMAGLCHMLYSVAKNSIDENNSAQWANDNPKECYELWKHAYVEAMALIQTHVPDIPKTLYKDGSMVIPAIDLEEHKETLEGLARGSKPPCSKKWAWRANKALHTMLDYIHKSKGTCTVSNLPNDLDVIQDGDEVEPELTDREKKLGKDFLEKYGKLIEN